MLTKPIKKSRSVTVSKDLDFEMCLSVSLTMGLQLAYKLSVSMPDSTSFWQFFLYFFSFLTFFGHIVGDLINFNAP